MGVSNRSPYLYTLAAVFFWSTVAAAFKVTLRYLTPQEMLFYAVLVSTAVLFTIMALQKKLHLLRENSGRDLLHSALLGFLNPFLYYLILFKAYALLPAQEAQPLNYTWPIMLVLLSVAILRQRVGWRSFTAVLVSFAGVFVISTRGDVLAFRFTDPFGVCLALSSSVVWALFWLYNARDKRDEVLKLFLNFVFALPLVLAAFIFFGGRAPTLPGAAGAFYVGLFEMGITFVFWLKALQSSRTAAQVGILVYASPFISLLFIHFVAGERILPSTLAGLVLIVAGILLQHLGQRRTAAPSA